MLVSANVSGSSFNEVTFCANVDNGGWKPIGTDDTRPYRVYHDLSSIQDGKDVTYRAVVVDNSGHQQLSSAKPAVVPAPKLTIESPAEGAGVFGTIEIRVTADPERASHVVRIQRKLSTDSDWVTLKTDDSSPVYTHYDNLSAVPVGTQIQYRAILDEPDGTQVISPVRTVTRTAPTPLVNSVTVAGSLQSEIGCPGDWDPACSASHLTFEATNGGLWKVTFQIPAGTYEYKVAIDDSWAVNYGAGGARNGANITISLAGTTSVTFVWDQVSHIVTHTTN
jgi:alpha-amylase